MREAAAHVASAADPSWARKSRVADDLLGHLVVERYLMPPAFVEDLVGWCAARGWAVSVQRRKVYAGLTKWRRRAPGPGGRDRIGTRA